MAYTEPEAANQNVGAINMGKDQVRYHILPQYEIFRIYIQNSNFINTISLDTNRHLYDIDVPNQIIKVDKNNYSLNTTSFNVELNFWLFGRNSDSTIYKSKNKLYKCKMYVSGVLVRDFIPCYRNSDNEVGLYDIVNGVFYTNQGTGAFTYGSVVTVPNTDFEIPIKVVTGNNVIRHVGKNLLDLSNGISNHGITTTLKDDGSVDLKGTTDTDWFNMTVSSGKRTKIRLLPGKYTFSVNEALNFSLRIKAFYKNYPAEYFHITINPGKTSGTFTVPRECDNFYVYAYGLTTGTVIDLNIKLQLEEGSTPTQYEPYRGEDYNLNLESIELCKIGDYEDILFKNEVGDENYNVELEVGAWYKKKVIDKKFLDGEMYFANSGVTNVFYTSVITNYSRINNIPLCDNFKGFNNVDTAHSVTIINSVGFNNAYNYNRLYISFNGTIDELKDFLNERKPTLYYANDNLTYEKITDHTLISQLEALRKAKWFKGVNHWWTETDNLDPVLAGTYKQSIQSETQNSIANLQVQANEQSISNTPESEV